MRSSRLQLLVTLLAVAFAAAVLWGRPLPPRYSLVKAADYRELSQVESCLRWGIHPDNACGTRHTALHVAADTGDGAMADLLLRHGASVEVRDRNDETPLIVAAHGDCARFDGVRRPSVRAGATAADIAAYHLESQRLWRDWSHHVAVAKLLVEHDADVNAKSQETSSAMYHAVHRCHREYVRFLLDNGVDAGAVCHGDSTPLHEAACFFWQRSSQGLDHLKGTDWTPILVDMMNLLIERGADVDAVNGSGITPLHRAANVGNVTAAGVLLRHGANVNIRDDAGRTPLGVAVDPGINFDREEVAELLRRHGGQE
ncbi:MAG: ankyrin repeat domain-containing protein [Planctomycetes bacterium]|nr:ankyrin repeat domain-containing protein [Planctomycetota bacterium]